MIEIQDLKHSYGDRPALQGVSFSVPTGEIFGVLGPNGGGKTTLFQILSTFLTPMSGTATISNFDIRKNPQAVRKEIGVIFQSPSLDKKLTVFENLVHAGHLYGKRGKELRDRIDTLMSRFGLEERLNEQVETLSGGLARRVEIAKALLHSPKVLLLDEPSTGLDPGARREVWKILKELRDQQKVTIWLTTHYMEEAEECDRVAIIAEGSVVALGTPSELKEAIAGKVITVETKDPIALTEKLRVQFAITAQVVDGSLRIEHSNGKSLVSDLMDRFPEEIEAVTIRTPTLEDVFVHHTGHRFWDKNAIR